MNNNKKLAIIALIIVIPLFLVLLNFSKNKKQANTTKETSGSNVNLNNPEAKNAEGKKMETKEPDKNAFTSIKDALSRNLALSCTYTDEKGTSVNTIIKGKDIYMETEQNVENVKTKIYGIMKDQKYYFWSEGSKQGIVMDLNKIAETSKMGTPENANAPKVQSADDVINDLENKKDNCKPTTVAQSKFDVPTSVTFMSF